MVREVELHKEILRILHNTSLFEAQGIQIRVLHDKA